MYCHGYKTAHVKNTTYRPRCKKVPPAWVRPIADSRSGANTATDHYSTQSVRTVAKPKPGCAKAGSRWYLPLSFSGSRWTHSSNCKHRHSKLSRGCDRPRCTHHHKGYCLAQLHPPKDTSRRRIGLAHSEEHLAASASSSHIPELPSTCPRPAAKMRWCKRQNPTPPANSQRRVMPAVFSQACVKTTTTKSELLIH